MRRPYTAIPMTKENMEAVKSGKISAGLRLDWRDYRTDDVLYVVCEETGEFLKGSITRVRRCGLNEVTPVEAKLSGSGKEGLEVFMKQFYPELKWNSPVTYFAFKLAANSSRPEPPEEVVEAEEKTYSSSNAVDIDSKEITWNEYN